MFPRKSVYVSSTAARTGLQQQQLQHNGSTATTPGRPGQGQNASQQGGATRQSAPLMTVAVRIRPLSQKELMNGHKPVVFAEGPSTASIAKLERMGAVLQSEKGQMHSYEFDHVFSEEATNREVYEKTARKLIPKVLDGMNCTIFAYGATGAGKTYSIMGNAQDPGMMPLSMIDLFDAISCSEDPSSYVVKVSYMEGELLLKVTIRHPFESELTDNQFIVRL